MKKITLIIILAFSFTACNNSNKNDQNQDQISSDQPDQNANVQTSVENSSIGGQQLIEMSDCSGCHNQNEKMIGPSYSEIAAKYSDTPENLDMLAKKIMEGGKGNWGEIPMAAHPNITKDQAQEIVKYILSQK